MQNCQWDYSLYCGKGVFSWCPVTSFDDEVANPHSAQLQQRGGNEMQKLTSVFETLRNAYQMKRVLMTSL